MSRPAPGGRRLAPFLLAASALLLLGTAVEAQERTAPGALLVEGDLHGTVLDVDSGEPIEGVELWVPELNLGYATRADGSFRIPEVTEGTYRIELRRLGYTEFAVTLSIEDPFPPLELELERNPVVLEGLEVVVDRFERRRRAAPFATRVIREDKLRTTSARDATELVFQRFASRAVSCPPRAHTQWCVWSRGRTIVPSVYIDEAPAIGGLDQLSTYLPHELYMVEVFAGGRHIRAYTHHFMQRAAEQRLLPLPLR